MSPSIESKSQLFVQLGRTATARSDSSGESSPPASWAARAVRGGRGLVRVLMVSATSSRAGCSSCGPPGHRALILARLTVESYFWAAEFALFSWIFSILSMKFVCILQQMHQCPAAEPSRLFCTRLVLSSGVVAIMAVRHKV